MAEALARQGLLTIVLSYTLYPHALTPQACNTHTWYPIQLNKKEQEDQNRKIEEQLDRYIDGQIGLAVQTSKLNKPFETVEDLPEQIMTLILSTVSKQVQSG